MEMKLSRQLWIIVIAIIIIVLVVGGWLMLTNKSASEDNHYTYNGHGGTYKNTLVNMDTPDPSMVYDNGYYYMTFTHNGTDIMVMRSRTIDFKQAEQKVVWYPPVGTMYSANLWAPELQRIHGQWYIYFAADDGDNFNHRMYVLEGITDDPMGEYTFKGQITDDTNKWAIDGLVMDYADQLYFVWSGWEGDDNIAQNTYIAPMSNPYTISGPRVLLSEPDLEWERAGGPPYINEGEAILYHDDQVHIAYSGAGSWTPYYSIGLLSLEKGADPLDASKWSKAKEPLMTWDEAAGVYGPGHNSFVTSPDASELFIVYHGTTAVTDGWSNRKARAQRVEWDDEGMPIFGKPLPLTAAIDVPLGSGILSSEFAVEEDDGYRFTSIGTVIDTATDIVAPIMLHYTNQSGAAKPLVVQIADQVIEITMEPTAEGELGYYYSYIPLLAGTKELVITGDGVKEHIIAMEITRYEAENGAAQGEAEAQQNPYASFGGAMTIHPGKDNGLLLSNIHVPYEGTYELNLAISNGSETDVSFELNTSAGSKQKASVAAGERNVFQSVSVKVQLKRGANAITIKQASGRLDVDYIDLVKKAN